jgi:hypothetical protein
MFQIKAKILLEIEVSKGVPELLLMTRANGVKEVCDTCKEEKHWENA